MTKSTVIVNLKRNWFGPDGSLYRVSANPHEFPADWMPDKADEDEEEVEQADYSPKVPSSAEVVKDGRVVEVQVMTANGAALLQPQAVEEGVKTVGNTVDETTKGPRDHNETHRSTSVAAATKAAGGDGAAQIGGKPRESGPPSQAGSKK